MTAGLEVINYIEKYKLADKSAKLGEYLKQKLKTLSYSCIIDVRGLGLMVGLSLENAEQVDWVLEEMKNAGFILGKNGINRDTIAFQPPLVITKEDIDEMLVKLNDVLQMI